MLKTVEKKQHKKKKEQWVNSSCGLSHSALRGNELTWEYGRMAACMDCRQRTLPLSLSTNHHQSFFFFLQCCWYGVLHYAIVLPRPSSENQHIPSLTSLSLPLSPSLPPSLTCPDINDTAIWGSGSSPALFPSCRLHSYTCTHSLTPNKILDTHPHTYTGHLQAHTHAHTYKNTTIHSKFISEAATDAFSLHTLI